MKLAYASLTVSTLLPYILTILVLIRVFWVGNNDLASVCPTSSTQMLDPNFQNSTRDTPCLIAQWRLKILTEGLSGRTGRPESVGRTVRSLHHTNHKFSTVEHQLCRPLQATQKHFTQPERFQPQRTQPYRSILLFDPHLLVTLLWWAQVRVSEIKVNLRDGQHDAILLTY